MELDYTVKRSAKRKKLTISVERDRTVVVHAPISASDEAIDKAVQSKRQWIYAKTHHEQKLHELPHPPGKEFVNGESALYLGKHYRIQIVDDETAKVHFGNGFTVPRRQASLRREALREWYLEQAREVILPRIDEQARNLGVQVRLVKIVDNRFRWGSCTPKDAVHINWRLIKAPMSVIDYVIVHELAHLLEENHTPRFWNIVRTHTAAMLKAKTWLKENGQLLEEEV
ncbi:hypothetical protein Pla108_26930 [Botrimarina colliarenosi]|uniref:YgjP-like metallopeptidase domain-containing protein n=1 Tax=Botrimarina colliarenosi TaxID=2528001 RepID=A0A5C6AC01_9BACT|nr:SprT family zinc-dependent metalloprotease [Botrimarina colliarenosi]TWT96917.1 hypothetical protein Pla108_26930 [Botrimarina colliarenosi]